jgi:hypothetical protein
MNWFRRKPKSIKTWGRISWEWEHKVLATMCSSMLAFATAPADRFISISHFSDVYFGKAGMNAITKRHRGRDVDLLSRHRGRNMYIAYRQLRARYRSGDFLKKVLES